MPAGAHTVSVVYRAYIYLPVIVSSVTTEPSGLAQTAGGAKKVSTQEIAGEQALAPDSAISEKTEAVAPSPSNPDTGPLDNNSAQVAAAQDSGKADLIDPSTSYGNDSTDAIVRNPVHRVLGLVAPFSCTLLLFVLLVCPVSALYVIRKRSVHKE